MHSCDLRWTLRGQAIRYHRLLLLWSSWAEVRRAKVWVDRSPRSTACRSRSGSACSSTARAWVGLLVDCESLPSRHSRQLPNRLRRARLKHDACIEDRGGGTSSSGCCTSGCPVGCHLAGRRRAAEASRSSRAEAKPPLPVVAPPRVSVEQPAPPPLTRSTPGGCSRESASTARRPALEPAARRPRRRAGGAPGVRPAAGSGRATPWARPRAVGVGRSRGGRGGTGEVRESIFTIADVRSTCRPLRRPGPRSGRARARPRPADRGAIASPKTTKAPRPDGETGSPFDAIERIVL